MVTKEATPKQIPECSELASTKMADEKKNFSFQFVPNKDFAGFESSDVKELLVKW